MFNLIVRSGDWDNGRATIPVGRMLEYTDEHVEAMFRQDANLLLDQLAAFPCIFMNEGINQQLAHVGQVISIRMVGGELAFEYTLDPEVPSLLNSILYENRAALDISHEFEFSRNHWAVKDVDLYRFLLRNVRPRRQRPTVFQIPEHEEIEPALASAMMPFDATYTPVFESIKQAASNVGLLCRRADDIWENAAIIQDVVALIDRSRIVICDCTGRNPNVFYEAGIAHTLGRDVILLAQNDQDIPFDLRHLRYLRYLNNAEGREVMANSLQERMETILGH